ncbi:MAG: DNA replication/repair protein RecF [Gemmatimonadota bacterium]
MALAALEIRDFRNLRNVACEFPASGAILIGPNGSGKTNLFEAIYYLEIFRSFRGARDPQLVRFGQDVFRIEAELRNGPRERLAAAYQRTGGRKKVEVDGVEVERLADALGAVGAVVFGLDDAELIGGAPGRRRRFLNILLSLLEPAHMPALQRYGAILGQRNEALRARAEPAVVDAWTDGLVREGGRVMEARARWIAERSAAFGDYCAAIGSGARGSLRYEPALGRRAGAPAAQEAAGDDVSEPAVPADAGVWGERLRAALADSADSERRRGATQVGPHRDDLVVTGEVDGEGVERDLRAYGSGGQRRTAAIALRLVEADSLRDRRGREPIYLLDDVFAELDAERSERVVHLLDEDRTGQVLLTAPKPSDVPLRGGGLAAWTIRDGEVRTDG